MNKDEYITIDTSIADDITFDVSDITLSGVDTITIDTATTINDGNLTITLDDTHWADGIVWEQTDFVDKMPSIDKIHNMVGYYPSLEKAYENFKTIYQMVEQDYKGNHQEDDETPF
tara:strand:- start:58 stop:405 length:348 start_codon:yes stop_codon:yes gene_type:complete